MIKASLSFLKRFHITRMMCVLLLVLAVSSLTGCGGDLEQADNSDRAPSVEEIMNGCWTCSFFQLAFVTVNNVSRTLLPKVAGSCVGLIAVGYGLWLAIFILKYVSSMKEPDVAAFWKGLAEQTFWAAMGAGLLRDLAGGGLGSALTSFAEPVFTGFVDVGLTVVSGTGAAPCPPAGNAETSMICLVRALQDKLNFGAGISWMGIFLGPTVFVMLIGLIIFVVSSIMMVRFPLLMLDGVFRYAIAICMLPLGVSAYIFKPTRKYTGKVAMMFMEIGFSIMGVCVFSACCVQVLKDYIDRFLPFVSDPLALLGNLDDLERVLCGPGITGLMFLCFFLILFGDVVNDFMAALVGGGVGGLGSTTKGTVNAVKGAANGARKLARFGANAVSRAKDKKAARTLQNAEKGSEEWNKANERMQRRGYLAKGADGKMHATAAFDNLTRNDRVKGPFKGLQKFANNMADAKQDYNQSAMEQSNSRHDHSTKGGFIGDKAGENGVSKDDTTYGKAKDPNSADSRAELQSNQKALNKQNGLESGKLEKQADGSYGYNSDVVLPEYK